MRRVVPPLIVLCLGFAPAPLPKPDPGKVDLEKMQGQWVLANAHRKGVREEVTQVCVWAIEGDRLDATLDGKKGSTCFITLNGRTSPRSIDLRNKRDEADPAPGRYRLDGDTLTVCIGERRPRDLSGDSVWVFERKKR